MCENYQNNAEEGKGPVSVSASLQSNTYGLWI